MKRILWVSRHAPTEEQTSELSRILNDTTIVITRYENTVKKAEEIVQKFKNGHFDDIVVVLPTKMIGRLCTEGIHPIEAVHEVTSVSSTGTRTFKFIRFDRIYSVKIKKSRLTGNE